MIVRETELFLSNLAVFSINHIQGVFSEYLISDKLKSIIIQL